MKTTDNEMTKQVITQVINAWEAQNKALAAIFEKEEDEAFLQELSPGRNRGIYVAGHLVAFSDGLLPMLGLGERLFPQLENIFVTNPDHAIADMPTLLALKESWQAVTAALTAHFATMKAEDWLGRHTKVSEEDFAKEPLRNKLNVLIGRTAHQAYHIGQLAFLGRKK